MYLNSLIRGALNLSKCGYTFAIKRQRVGEERKERGKKIFVVRGSGGVGRSGKCGENLEAGDSEKVRATIWIVIRGNAGT